MKCRALTKWWKNMSLNRGKSGVHPTSEMAPIHLAPLDVAVRIDLRVATGRGRETPASRLVWVSPSRSAPSAWTLRTFVLPN